MPEVKEIQEKVLRLLGMLNEDYDFIGKWVEDGCSHGIKPAKSCPNNGCWDKRMHLLWEELRRPQSSKGNETTKSSVPDKPTPPPQMPPPPYLELSEDQKLKMSMAKDMVVAVLPQLIQTPNEQFTEEHIMINVINNLCTYSEMIFNRFEKWI
jgi:hypothetical protein